MRLGARCLMLPCLLPLAACGGAGTPPPALAAEARSGGHGPAATAVGAPSAAAVRPEAAPDRAPRAGDWLVATGPFYMDLDARFAEVGAEETPAGGLFVAAEHLFHPAFGIELAVSATPEIQTDLFATSVFSSDDELAADIDIMGIFATLKARLYPLRLDPALVGAWLQPYGYGSVGSLILETDLIGTVAVLDETALARADLTEVMGMWEVGLGLSAALGRRWGVYLEGGYLASFAEPNFTAVLDDTVSELSFELRSLLARLGVQFRF
jgi:hypothetical protein